PRIDAVDVEGRDAHEPPTVEAASQLRVEKDAPLRSPGPLLLLVLLHIIDYLWFITPAWPLELEWPPK
ncbi:MAG: hypothetical protein ACXW3D_10050, partial [Caulobacteraceae bacterium]